MSSSEQIAKESKKEGKSYEKKMSYWHSDNRNETEHRNIFRVLHRNNTPAYKYADRTYSLFMYCGMELLLSLYMEQRDNE